MGDRANVEFRFSRGTDAKVKASVYLYTHWAGDDLPGLVQKALGANRGRWDDDEYLCRAVITGIVHGYEECLHPTGWGVSPWPGDGEDRVLVLDMRGQLAWVESQTHGPQDPPERQETWQSWMTLPDLVGW